MSPFHVVEVDTFLLTFTPDNWDEPQTVTITTREDDDSIDAWAAVVHTIDADRSSNASSIRVLITDLDQPLAVTGPTSVNYAENDISSAATYSVTTARAGRINWRLLGHDKDDFSISGTGALTFDSPPDHEAPTDSNMDNVYRVTVHASGRSSTGVLLDVAITVADVGGPAAPRLVAASPVQPRPTPSRSPRRLLSKWCGSWRWGGVGAAGWPVEPVGLGRAARRGRFRG